MALSNDEVNALRRLLREEIRGEIAPFRDEFQEFRNEVSKSFDALFKLNESREHEYLAIKEQVGRLESASRPGRP